MSLVTKKKDRIEFSIGQIKFTFYRYFRILREVFLMLHYMLLNETLQQRFNISLPKEAYHHLSGNIELVYVALKDIHVPCGHRKTCPITGTRPYQWLSHGKTDSYCRCYSQGNVYVPEDTIQAQKRMEALESNLADGYDVSRGIVCLRKNNVCIDGQHRCAVLYHLYGGEHRILVAREK